jgi:hypothetical protein
MFDLDGRVALITGVQDPVWACLSPAWLLRPPYSTSHYGCLGRIRSPAFTRRIEAKVGLGSLPDDQFEHADSHRILLYLAKALGQVHETSAALGG